MRKWLDETHGPVFELYRHFLLGFFDSDLITATGQTASALFGVISMLLPSFLLFVQPLKFKFDYFSKLPAPGPYREAVRADQLWLITLTMSAIGVLTCIKWQSLFPGLRDYRALASLPVRARQVFAGKALALMSVAGAAVFVANLPSLLFPAISYGRWAISKSSGAEILAQGTACAAGCAFFFFALVGLQGLLLNVLRPRVFERLSGYLQGSLVAAMVILVVLSFSIQAQFTNAAIQSEWAHLLPPLWFLGLHDAMAGNRDPVMLALAHTGRIALAVAAGSAIFTYFLSYRRHRALIVEGVNSPAKPRRWPGAVLEWLLPDAREQAIVAFLVKTMAGSAQHRMILMGYGGFGLAVLLSGIIGLKGIVSPDRVPAACFVYAHVILLTFLLIGLRHLFALPTELGANWTFRIMERDGRRHWMRALDRLILATGATVMVAMPFPSEAALLGWRALSESALFAVFGLLCYEWAFVSWEKLPFTCSYCPGKTPAWIMALKTLGLLSVLPVVCAAMLACLYNAVAYVAALIVIGAAWARMRMARVETWGEVRLIYEDLPDPEVHSLDLLR